MAGCCAGRGPHEPYPVWLSARTGLSVRNRNVGTPLLLRDARASGRLSGQVSAAAGPCRTCVVLPPGEIPVRRDGADPAVFLLGDLRQLYGTDVRHPAAGRLAG